MKPIVWGVMCSIVVAFILGEYAYAYRGNVGVRYQRGYAAHPCEVVVVERHHHHKHHCCCTPCCSPCDEPPPPPPRVRYYRPYPVPYQNGWYMNFGLGGRL